MLTQDGRADETVMGMKNDLGLGYVWGFLISFIGFAFWVTEPESDPIFALAGWVHPATFVFGLILLARPRFRRLGVGIVLGSLTVAVLYVLFIVWVISQIGS